ncbi:photosystem II stability/assembly factor-like uncharacterized protein [Parabacteroides sp. PF5-5]|uniref:WD40/YVTN/BNR-like repeat-containing protein n=1 Tax=unclassified Parabacteroides TaxID=2649774 RepID=UPI0024767B25|nr:MULTISPECIES: sialidase family protein [unclassified Parabacteroides]MDH6303420.1 photosystem II stability/assembly factor-like uncharacterized protein [Parabacteroides sp. PH5-39]MDH6314743.1 photosystem II stability/assembly factor-like uncharacterized protein [Parabacteroides sp. PF5-13]MDH6318080.1 photosystem II stability/assembly factor-like uncharacterized protein [Parabacteroides sp. PH5-13]MDH6321989.1 photosystem II stability/assembly factor-like uncharacterized protein [Parabacter
MKKSVLLTVCLLLGMQLAAQQSLQPSVPSEPYQWKSVQIVGGGFVDGIVFHPKAKDVRYCRTDMGGAYRWDAASERWISMLDWITYDDNNLVGVESIAVDPSDLQTVYLSCGTYTRSSNGAVLCSHDGGRSFTRIDMPFAMGGNENGRGNGERMMVDPANSRIIYLGTRHDGLWKSTDKGQSWERLSTFPDVTEIMPELPPSSQPRNPWANRPQGSGIIFVHYDESTAVPGKGCATIYVGVSLMNRENLFVSHDHGAHWQAVAGQPTQYRPTHAALASDGELYITYGSNPGPQRMEDGGVWKYNTKTGLWKEISPVKPNPDKDLKFGYASVSVDPQNPKHVIASSFNLAVPNSYAEDDIYRSTDGGKTWKGIFAGKAQFDYTKAPYTQFTPLHWMFDIEIDPFNPNHAMFTTGYGGWETFNLSAQDKKKPVVWQIMSTGIEETVPLEIYSPNEGAHLITAIGDYGGFTHFDLDSPSPTGSHKPYYGNTNGVSGAEKRPELVVRVGTVSHHHPEGKPLAYSQDGGISWSEPQSLPDEKAANGYIAVSADGESWIWSPFRLPVFYTRDRGASWHKCQGIPDNIRVVADRVNPARFYGFDIASGLLYESRDGGQSFTSRQLLPALPQTPLMRADRRGGQDKIYTTPGREADRWIAAYDGLYHLLPDNQLLKLDKVRKLYAFGFGKEAPGRSYPALYMIGIVNGTYGFFRSDDAAKSWVRINDDDHQYGLVLHISGDPKKYGRVYVGTHGRGTLYGDPIGK